MQVRAKAEPKEDRDESFKRARDAVARFGRKSTNDPDLLEKLGVSFNVAPPKNLEPNDEAAAASLHGLAVAGCAGCSIPENRR